MNIFLKKLQESNFYLNSMRTIDEAAQECAIRSGFLSDFPHHGRSVEYGFKECAKFMQQWISVEEELPDEENGYSDKQVLVKRFNDFERTELDYKVTKYNERGWEEYSRITHWRPIENK